MQRLGTSAEPARWLGTSAGPARWLCASAGRGALARREGVRESPREGYYALADANERLGELRPLLDALRDDREVVAQVQRRLERLRAGNGDPRDEIARERDVLVAAVHRMESAVRQIDAWGITLRDIGTGLVDFPALASGRPIWLCWKLGEKDIAWWHELDAGVAGRRPLIDLE